MKDIYVVTCKKETFISVNLVLSPYAKWNKLAKKWNTLPFTKRHYFDGYELAILKDACGIKIAVEDNRHYFKVLLDTFKQEGIILDYILVED